MLSCSENIFTISALWAELVKIFYCLRCTDIVNIYNFYSGQNVALKVRCFAVNQSFLSHFHGLLVTNLISPRMT